MKRKPTVKALKKKTWDTFSKYIRLLDCLKTTGSPYFGFCVTCGKPFDILHLQAGHFIPGRHNAGLFSERGVHAQCRRCNYLGGETLEYRRQIIKMYGHGADEELEQEARQSKKFTIEELQGLLEKYRGKIKELEGL